MPLELEIVPVVQTQHNSVRQRQVHVSIRYYLHRDLADVACCDGSSTL